jgi:hypothetical protein
LSISDLPIIRLARSIMKPFLLAGMGATVPETPQKNKNCRCGPEPARCRFHAPLNLTFHL